MFIIKQSKIRLIVIYKNFVFFQLCGFCISYFVLGVILEIDLIVLITIVNFKKLDNLKSG